MENEIKRIIEEAQQYMEKAMQRLDRELLRVRTGKASPVLVEDIVVDYYGTPTPMAQVANISVADARTLIIQPWEKNMLQAIEKAIQKANIGINPQNDGTIVRLSLPVQTEERRKELVRSAYAAGELARVGIRSARRDAIEQLKKMEKEDALSEDAFKDSEKEVQDLTDKFVGRVEVLLKAKEEDIMKI